MKLLCGVLTREYFWIYLQLARLVAHTAEQNINLKQAKKLGIIKF
jgi:hypothetical protein